MIDNIEADPRVALQVMRYHTWPTAHRQSVGEHSAQVARILVTVWPDCPRKMLIHCILHDVGEMAGDVPYPGKRNDPVLKERMDAAEAKIHGAMVARWNLPGARVMSEYEQAVFKLCEYLEMWEFGLHEQNRGNRYGAVIAMRMLLASSASLENLPNRGEYPDIRPAVYRYVERRKLHERGTEEKK